MKYENFEEAKEIKGQIDDYKYVLKGLGYNNISIQIHNYGEILTLFPGDGDQLTKITSNYLDAIKAYYETEIELLTKELEEL